MVDVVKCSNCGKNNSVDDEFCQYCQARLQPLTGPLKGVDIPLHPGEVPTKRVTAELEPILPQWLRDARDSARQSAEEEAIQTAQRQEQTPPANTSVPDLLAGLRSQSHADDEDDTPDWLANITGVSPKSKKTGLDLSDVRRVEIGDKDDFARLKTAPLEKPSPSRLVGKQSPPESSDKDDLADWFRQSGEMETRRVQAPPADQGAAPSSPSDSPDWLEQMTTGDDASAGAPAWLDSGVQDQAEKAAASPFIEEDFGVSASSSLSSGDVPGWLRGFETPDSAVSDNTESEWLRDHQSKEPDPVIKKNTTPLWLKGLSGSGASAEEPVTPAWLEDSPSVIPASAATPPPAVKSEPAFKDDSAFGDIPDWLKAAAPQSSVFAETPQEQIPPAAPPEASNWLSTFKSTEPSQADPFAADQAPASTPPPAFTTDVFQNGNLDSLFTEMPDWLSSVSSESASDLNASSSTDSSGLTAPGELPSWVQAMRPIDSGISRSAPPVTSDRTIESRGTLAGLQGVLPSVTGYRPSSKPKAYSIKLQVTQEQQSHAALLEQILSAETEPVPISSFSPLRASRGLRWALSFMIVGLIFMAVFLNIQLPIPAGSSAELAPIDGAMTVAQAVPLDGQVLVAMDYQPARAGEMEAAAAPMFDQMLLLRHPRLIFISTNETGPILAERFISGSLAERNYQYGSQYLNLGYLPGGMMGIRSFVQDPKQTMQFDISLSSAWESTALQGVASLSQFAALIVVTDNADSARAWIEQTMSLRKNTSIPMVVVASAQAAPMVMPYYDSGQVNGIVNGLYGGAISEKKNAGRPGTARAYWDAYSLGMLLTMVLMVGGGFWSFALGLINRAAAVEAG